jgi:hypothetical protein
MRYKTIDGHRHARSQNRVGASNAAICSLLSGGGEELLEGVVFDEPHSADQARAEAMLARKAREIFGREV